jgi:hypothetical protein
VTWYWVGPDTMHSVTGTSANDAGWDSDPNVSTPRHRIGDSYKLGFTSPGTYTFQCKLHPTVRGTVVVSSTPGDPTTEVDPIPRSNLDLKAPFLTGVRLHNRRFARAGTLLHFALDERASVDAEYFRIRPRRHRGQHGRRRFAGWQKWHAHVGYNGVTFASRAPHFRPRPGRYMAVLRATDSSSNTGLPKRVPFTIR